MSYGDIMGKGSTSNGDTSTNASYTRDSAPLYAGKACATQRTWWLAGGCRIKDKDDGCANSMIPIPRSLPRYVNKVPYVATVQITTTILATAAVAQVVPAVLNYYVVPKDAERDPFFDGSVIETTREYAPVSTKVTDIRGHETDFTLDEQGFQLVKHSTAEKDFKDDEHIKDVYYRDVERLLKDKTGCSRVFVQNHVIRRQSWEASRDSEGHHGELAAQAAPTSSRFCHVDYSPEGAEAVLGFFLGDEAEKLSKTRWGIIDAWRPLTEVHREQLCVADARSLSDDELHAKLIKEPVPDGEDAPSPITTQMKTYLWSVKPPQDPAKHKWYYASNMTPDEILLFKTYDSKKDGVARRSPHTAFATPTDSGPPRESIDLRCFVFWEDQALE